MADAVKKGIMRSLDLFVSAVERTSNLEIVCEEEVDGKDVLVVENSDVDAHIEGHQCTVDVSEIFAKVKTCKDAQAFVDVITGARHPIVCEGITRIVGYYSRTHNWNKSKIGELRDRQHGQYGTGKHEKVFKAEALEAVDSL